MPNVPRLLLSKLQSYKANCDLFIYPSCRQKNSLVQFIHLFSVIHSNVVYPDSRNDNEIYTQHHISKTQQASIIILYVYSESVDFIKNFLLVYNLAFRLQYFLQRLLFYHDANL